MKGQFFWYALLLAMALFWLFPKEAGWWTLLTVTGFIIFISSIDNYITRKNFA